MHAGFQALAESGCHFEFFQHRGLQDIDFDETASIRSLIVVMVTN